MKSARLLAGALALAAIVLTTKARADTRTWTGGGADSSWSTPGNWSGNAVPDADGAALFDGTSSKDCVIDVDVEVGVIEIKAEYTGTITQAAGVSIAVNVEWKQDDGTFRGSDGPVAVMGPLTLKGGAFLAGSGVMAVSGELKVEEWGTFDAEARVVDAGGPVTILGGVFGAGTSAVTVSGVFKQDGGALDLGEADILLRSHLVLAGGALGPGSSVLRFVGSADQDADFTMTPAFAWVSVEKTGGVLRFVKQGFSADRMSIAAGSTVEFTPDEPIVLSKLDWKGEPGSPVVVRSVDAGVPWTLVIPPDQWVRHVDVRESEAPAGAAVTAYNSIDSGGNANWVFLEDYDPPDPPTLPPDQPSEIFVSPGQETVTILVELPPDAVELIVETEPPLYVVEIIPGASPDEIVIGGVSLLPLGTSAVVLVSAVDGGGNASDPVAFTITAGGLVVAIDTGLDPASPFTRQRKLDTVTVTVANIQEYPCLVSLTGVGVKPLTAGTTLQFTAVPLPKEGPNLLRVTANDAACNSGRASEAVFRDTKAPEISVATPLWHKSGHFDFLYMSEHESLVDVSVLPEDRPFTRNVIGPYTLWEVTFVDLVAGLAEWSVKRDATVIVSTLESGTLAGRQYFFLTGLEDLNMEDGDYKIIFHAADTVGNEAEYEIKVRLDRKAPDVSAGWRPFEQDPLLRVRTDFDTIDVQLGPSSSGLHELRLIGCRARLMGDWFVPPSVIGPGDYQPQADGTVAAEVFYRAEDYAGNVSQGQFTDTVSKLFSSASDTTWRESKQSNGTFVLHRWCLTKPIGRGPYMAEGASAAITAQQGDQWFDLPPDIERGKVGVSGFGFALLVSGEPFVTHVPNYSAFRGMQTWTEDVPLYVQGPFPHLSDAYGAAGVPPGAELMKHRQFILSTCGWGLKGPVTCEYNGGNVDWDGRYEQVSDPAGVTPQSVTDAGFSIAKIRRTWMKDFWKDAPLQAPGFWEARMYWDFAYAWRTFEEDEEGNVTGTSIGGLRTSNERDCWAPWAINVLQLDRDTVAAGETVKLYVRGGFPSDATPQVEIWTGGLTLPWITSQRLVTENLIEATLWRSVELDVTVPDDAPPGDYDVHVTCLNAGGEGVGAYLMDEVLKVVKADLVIYNGQEAAAPVADADEVLTGAFTVANLNNTDDDTKLDRDDTNVPDEEDLMQLVLTKPEPDDLEGTVRVRIAGGQAAIWESDDKSAGQVTGSDLEVDISSITTDHDGDGKHDIQWWVEATDASESLQDISLVYEIRLSPGGEWIKCDEVRATGVWARRTGFRNKTTDALWADAGEPLRTHFNIVCGGKLGIQFQTKGLELVAYGTAMEFTVTPTGVGDEPGVVFDVTRQIEYKDWGILGGTFQQKQVPWKTFPAGDLPNDESQLATEQEDNDKTPQNDHIYSYDAPGERNNGLLQQIVSRNNFYEFVRVRFDGQLLYGRNLQGSRCSEKSPWHVFYWIKKKLLRPRYKKREGRPNEVEEGHKPLGEKPVP